MLPSRNRIVLTAAALVGLLGCQGKPPASADASGKSGDGPPKGSPEEVFVEARDALREMDFDTVYDMLSMDARVEVDSAMKKTAESVEAMGSLAREILGFDPAELRGLPAREVYAKVMAGAHKAKADLESSFSADRADTGLAGAEVAGSETQGDRAKVTVKLASGAARVIELIRENGAWKLAKPLSLQTETSAEPQAAGESGPRQPSGGTKADTRALPPGR